MVISRAEAKRRTESTPEWDERAVLEGKDIFRLPQTLRIPFKFDAPRERESPVGTWYGIYGAHELCMIVGVTTAHVAIEREAWEFRVKDFRRVVLDIFQLTMQSAMHHRYTLNTCGWQTIDIR